MPDASRVVYHQDFTGTPTTTFSAASMTSTSRHSRCRIIAGNGALSGGQYAGVAPDANLIDLRVSTPMRRL